MDEGFFGEHLLSPVRLGHIAFLVLLVAYLLVLHATLPGINAPTLATQASLVGQAKCIADSGNIFSLVCNRLGYPVGVRFLQGYPQLVFMALLYRYLSLPLVDGMQLFYTSCILLGVISLVVFACRRGASAFVGLIAAFVFYSAPFVTGSAGYGGLYPGFLLFPFYLFTSLFLLDHIYSKASTFGIVRLLPLLALQFLLLQFSVFMDGYSYAMAVSAIAIFCLGDLIHSLWIKRELDGSMLALFFVYVFILLAPGLVYQSLAFKAPPPVFSMDFYRGEGIDLITTIVPTQRQSLLASVLKLGPVSWNAHAFYSDGSNANGNFIGIATALSAIAAVYLALIGREQDRKTIIALACVLAVGFVFSLGPSLKVNSTRSAADSSTFQGGDYLMPPESALLSLPTAPLFKLPVLSTMRATYRWQLMTRFALAVLVGYFIIGQMRARPFLALLVFCIIILENLPAAIVSSQPTSRLHRAQVEAFTLQIVDAIRPHVENERVLFLPAANDFLVTMITPFTNSYSYNLAGDKELLRIWLLQPAPIINAERSFESGSLKSEQVCSLFQAGLVDRVVFTYFDLRWDAYSWPPTRERIEQYRQKAEALHLEEQPGLTTKEEPLFLIVSGNPSVANCSPP